MKHLLLVLLAFSQPEDASESLGNQLAIKAECSRIENELIAFQCDEYTDFDIFKMYLSSFVRGYSDITQTIAWVEFGDDNYGTSISYNGDDYLLVFNESTNIFVIIKYEEEA